MPGWAMVARAIEEINKAMALSPYDPLDVCL